jgi:RNA polymerase sigma-70 factor, ECF subfamily
VRPGLCCDMLAAMSTDSAAALSRPEGDDLGARALAGDRAAEREICSRLLPAVRAFAQRRLRAASAAEDFAQDVLVLLIEALRERRVHEPERIASFALGICRNLSRERARTGERRRELMAQYGVSEAELAGAGAPGEPSRGHLEDCYSQLTERARRVIRASFCDDDADAQIGAALAISEANVRVIRHRALGALRSCLERPISWGQA